MRIVNDTGRELAHDGKTHGELQVRGPHVVRRYYRVINQALLLLNNRVRAAKGPQKQAPEVHQPSAALLVFILGVSSAQIILGGFLRGFLRMYYEATWQILSPKLQSPMGKILYQVTLALMIIVASP